MTQATTKKHQVFVYGTLKHGFWNNRLLENAEYVGNALIEGLDLFSLGGFPGVVDGTGRVVGEVYMVDDLELKHLDRLEGNGSFYTREQRNTLLYQTPDGTDKNNYIGESWVYVLPNRHQERDRGDILPVERLNAVVWTGGGEFT